MSEKKQWLKSEIDELINIYHNKPELWDVKSKIYRDRIKKRNSVLEISQHFGTSVEEVSRKIHNLRNQWNSEQKKTVIKHSGDGADDTYNSKWPFFKALSFLQNGLLCRATIGNIVQDGVEEETVSEQDGNQDPPEREKSPGENLITKKQKTSTVVQSFLVSKERRSRQNNNLAMEKALAIINEQEDQYDVFGKYVANEIRIRTSENLQKKLKRKIQQAILEIAEEEERLDNNECVCNTSSNPRSAVSNQSNFSNDFTYSENILPSDTDTQIESESLCNQTLY